MKNYDTVSEAVTDLIKRGFKYDFNIQHDGIECPEFELKIHPENFEIVEFYRFEGDTDPADEAVVYAIQSNEGLKGILVNGYGIYSESLSDAMVSKLKEHII